MWLRWVDRRPRVAKIASELISFKDDAAREKYGKKQDAEVIFIKSSNAPAAWLYLSPRSRSTLPQGLAIEPLLRVVELGMDVCALRAGTHKSGLHEQADELTGTS